MARIRSIHPRIWTDEAFMAASPLARLLWIGIWTEAFDDGVFEWKPLSLKARLFPADAIDVCALLEELKTLDFIQSFLDPNAKPKGVVRNFQKFQRPQKPNSSGVLPQELCDYAGAPTPRATGAKNLARDKNRLPVPNSFESDPLKSLQKEGKEEGTKEGTEGKEEGTEQGTEGKRKKEGKEEGVIQVSQEDRSGRSQGDEQQARGAGLAASNNNARLDTIETKLRAAAGCPANVNPSPGLFNLSDVLGLLDQKFDLDDDICAAIQAKPNPHARSWKYFIPQILEFRARRMAAKTASLPPLADSIQQPPLAASIQQPPLAASTKQPPLAASTKQPTSGFGKILDGMIDHETSSGPNAPQPPARTAIPATLEPNERHTDEIGAAGF